MIKKNIGRILAFLFIVFLAFGIGTTYERYRGTDLSRVPVVKRVPTQRLKQARYRQETTEGASTTSGTEDTNTRLTSVDSNGKPLLAENEMLSSAISTESLGGTTDELLLYPSITKGMRTPFDLWRYYGRGRSSFGSPILPMRFDQWLNYHRKQKPKLMRDVHAYMNGRFDFSGKAIPGQYMSGGKPIMKGPVARLPKGIGTYEQLATLSATEIRERDLFPYKPLAHPLQSVAHMVFPDSWIKVHPEHSRIDVDLDIPDDYLPEFPPPMFLTTHKELGDITNGQEVTLDNFFEIFDGLITPEQMEGLKELLRPSATTWFNHTDHRITEAPSKGVACFDCHVNGHTNGAIELGPDARPNLARLRTETPTMRGNYNLMQLSSKRSIRSMDHFSEVEEYFDGDPGMQQAIGPRAVKREVTNRMADFNAILDYPPAPKLNPLMRLIPDLCSEQELRGETLFHGKAQCVKCHSGPAFVDDYMHDLRVERFYVGRPEGPIKTFPLRGIKDSPPYLHDGRLPTLHDTVEFFNVVLELDLNEQEKDDLVAYMLCL
ncbi:cytochrome C [Planctomycetota bacterium]